MLKQMIKSRVIVLFLTLLLFLSSCYPFLDYMKSIYWGRWTYSYYDEYDVFRKVILEFDLYKKPEHYHPYAFEEWAPGNGFGYLLLEVIKYSSEGDIIAHDTFLGDFMYKSSGIVLLNHNEIRCYFHIYSDRLTGNTSIYYDSYPISYNKGAFLGNDRILFHTPLFDGNGAWSIFERERL